MGTSELTWRRVKALRASVDDAPGKSPSKHSTLVFFEGGGQHLGNASDRQVACLLVLTYFQGTRSKAQGACLLAPGAKRRCVPVFLRGTRNEV